MNEVKWWYADRREGGRIVWCKTSYWNAARLANTDIGVRLATSEELPDYEGKLGPGGRKLCHWCREKEVGRGMVKYCSERCRNERNWHVNWTFSRATVARRDKGICVICGWDTEAAKRWWERIRRHSWEAWRLAVPSRRTDWWDADHIIARRDGGSNHPDNLRTLCVFCHKARTREQQRLWAMERRAKRDPEPKLFALSPAPAGGR